ncbi:hypothetical protein CEE36_03770 [candidate division TA06 bacterium B3_TA06]|uniref:FlgD Ig-like domain-containing protein n=1 Tax=candidate division TA06 bacterium B3_TA06 TaxID=2012487 RepID=A0A532V8C5_UNCT6|nr:MAG: hypothetical protein CEE36_03770 [candidate division TA06 bacterium B3_TA06]
MMPKKSSIDTTKRWGRAATILGLLLAATTSAQVWGPDTKLSDVPPFSWMQKVAASDDNIHVVWEDNRDEDVNNTEVYYKRSTDNGETWGDDTRLTNAPRHSHWPSIAVWEENIHVVWEDYRNGSSEIYYKRSTDNGETWGDDIRFTNASGGFASPSIAVLGDTIHVVWDDYCDGDQEIYYKRSTDNGETWGDDTRITNASGWSGASSIAVLGDNIHVVWKDLRDGDPAIYYKRSTDNGQTWGADTALTEAENNVLLPCNAVFGNNIHVVWFNYWNKYEIYYKRSTDNGATWGDNIRLSEDDGYNSANPSIAVLGDTIHLVWDDWRDGIGEIYYKRSTDNGQTWGDNTRITDNDDKRSVNPSIAVWEGNIHVVWEDNRDGWTKTIYYKHGREGNLQPDNQVKNDIDDYYIGDDIYNLDGTNQVEEQAVLPGDTAVFYIKVESDGDIPDTIMVTGAGSTTGWTVSYYDALTGGTDITASVTGSGWATGKLEPEDYIEMRVEITPDVSVPMDSSYEFLVTSTSSGDPLMQDAVKIRTATGVGIEESAPQIPVDYYLEVSANPPVIQYGIPKAGKMSVVIAEVTGRVVRTLVSGEQSAGYHQVIWDRCDDRGTKLPAGVYFCQLRTQKHSVVRKLILLQ